MRRPEHQGEAGGVQQADESGHHAAVAREKAVGEHAGDDGPGDAGDSVDADNPGRLQGGISFILLEKEDPPGVDGVAVDVHKGGGEGEGPQRRVAQRQQLVFKHRAAGFDLLLRFIADDVDGREAAALRRIVHEQHQQHHAGGTERGGGQVAHLPAKPGDHRGDHHIGHRLADIMRRRPDAIEGAALLNAVPARQRDRAGADAHRLRPAVDPPEDGQQQGVGGHPHHQVHPGAEQ